MEGTIWIALPPMPTTPIFLFVLSHLWFQLLEWKYVPFICVGEMAIWGNTSQKGTWTRCLIWCGKVKQKNAMISCYLAHSQHTHHTPKCKNWGRVEGNRRDEHGTYSESAILCWEWYFRQPYYHTKRVDSPSFWESLCTVCTHATWLFRIRKQAQQKNNKKTRNGWYFKIFFLTFPNPIIEYTSHITLLLIDPANP